MKKVVLSLLLAFSCLPLAFGQLTANHVIKHDTMTACNEYTWPVNNQTYNKDTAAIYVTPDTIYLLDLTVKMGGVDTTHARVINGTCFVRRGTKTYSTTGTYFDTVKVPNQCDSIIKIKVVLWPEHSDTTFSVDACDYYVTTKGDTLKTSQTKLIIDTVGACYDSTTINLTIHNSYTKKSDAVVKNIAAGCFYKFGDSTFTDLNVIHYKTDTTAFGCDSITAIKIISYSHTQYDTNNVAHCGNKYRWAEFGNKEYTVAGTYDTTSNVVISGDTCHLTSVLNLTFVENDSLITGTVCEKYTLLNFDRDPSDDIPATNIEFTESGIYTTDNNGLALYTIGANSKCRTNFTLNLTIKQPEQRLRTGTVDTASCDKFIFRIDGKKVTLTKSADTTISMPRRNSGYCYDSIASLRLQIKNSTFKDTNIATCDQFLWSFNGKTYTSSVTDSVTLDVKNSVGCDSSGRLKLIIRKSPVVTIEGKWILQPGESTVLHAHSSMSGTKYKWYMNGSAAYSSNNDPDSLTVTAADNSNINIKLESTQSYPAQTLKCNVTSWLTITSNDMGIEDPENINLNIYPNPTSRLVNINSNKTISKVVIYNAIGQQVIIHEDNNNQMQLDLGALANGNYTMNLTTSNGEQVTRKLIVNK